MSERRIRVVCACGWVGRRPFPDGTPEGTPHEGPCPRCEGVVRVQVGRGGRPPKPGPKRCRRFMVRVTERTARELARRGKLADVAASVLTDAANADP